MTFSAATQARIAPRRAADTLSERGARRLVNTIECYRRGRGYEGIRCTMEHTLGWASEDDRGHAILVRSNLNARGFPPRKAA